MPTRVEYTEDGLGVSAYNEGLTTSEQIISTLTQIYQDARYPKLRYSIRDISKAEKLALSFEETKQIAELETRESKRNPGILMAIVVGTDHTYAIANMYRAFSHLSNTEIKIFLSRELADEWISSGLNSANQEHQNGNGSHIDHN